MQIPPLLAHAVSSGRYAVADDGKSPTGTASGFQDRLTGRQEVLNPGGLYGTMTIDTLGKPGVSSARNQRFTALLEDVPFPDGGMVAENRGTGYATIEAEVQRALMPPQLPRDEIAGSP